jgi:phage FluMu protein Com
MRGRIEMTGGCRTVAKAAASERDLRCLCGRLVARWVGADIELRCQRCKRIILIAIAADGTLQLREDV